MASRGARQLTGSSPAAPGGARPPEGGSVFGETVRAHRHRMGLSQEDLAGKTGVSVRTIRELEAGRITRPRPGTLRLLAEAFALTDAERQRFFSAAGRSG